MKAWFVFVTDEWGELVHADTRGHAKALAMREFEVEDYLELNAIRVKNFDDTAITFQNCDVVDWHYVDENDQLLKESEFYNICKCDICQGAKQ